MKVLNLGCGNPDARSWHPIEGADNRDKSLGWRFEDGLPDCADGSVDGITVSHALMYVAIADWPFVFAEFARVLGDGGVVRITEDDTSDTRSRTYKTGWHDAVTLTYPAMVKAELERAGLIACDVYADSSQGHASLIQQQHGDPPHVFFVEGVRMNRVLFSPHNDDETLFAAFTILQYRPRVVVCYPSTGDYGDSEVRTRETADAVSVLGAPSWEQWGGGDILTNMQRYDATFHPSKVFAPSSRTSHPDHRRVAVAAQSVFGDRVTRYHTYDEHGKVRDGTPAPYEPIWIQHKLRALARYESQITHPRACKFFMDDLTEYLDE